MTNERMPTAEHDIEAWKHDKALIKQLIRNGRYKAAYILLGEIQDELIPVMIIAEIAGMRVVLAEVMGMSEDDIAKDNDK